MRERMVGNGNPSSLVSDFAVVRLLQPQHSRRSLLYRGYTAEHSLQSPRRARPTVGEPDMSHNPA